MADQIVAGASTAITDALMLNVLLFSMLLGAQVLLRSRTHGLRFALSSLDGKVRTSILEDRLQRVKTNQLEFLALLLPVATVAAASGTFVRHACWIALAFVAGRTLYTFVALAGVPVLRSASWLIGFLAWSYLLAQVSGIAGLIEVP